MLLSFLSLWSSPPFIDIELPYFNPYPSSFGSEVLSLIFALFYKQNPDSAYIKERAELFKKDSFIDTNNYHNFKDLFEHITTMTDEEYLNRLNLCIETYNKAFDSIDFYQQYYLMIDNIIKKLKTAK